MKLSSRVAVPPKTFEKTGRGKALLGVSGEALCRIENEAKDLPLAKEGEKLLDDRFAALTGDTPKRSGAAVIRLTLGAAPEGVENADQGYSIDVGKNGVTLCGFGEAGLFYACVTLSQLLALDKGEIALPYLHILDWPDIKRRGHFLESRYGSDCMELEDFKSVIDDMVSKKQNILTVSLYGCWQIQYDGAVTEYVYYKFKKFPKLKTPMNRRYYSAVNGKWTDETALPPIFRKNFFFDLAAYGKRFGVEVVPLINSYGHNTLIPSQYPETSARFENGKPTLNGFCTSTKKTYDLLFALYDDIIDNVLKPLGIESFDIGLDEIGHDTGIGRNASDPFGIRPDLCRCKKCAGKTPIEIYIGHAIKLASYLKSRGMKTVYVYSDMLCRAGRPPEEDYMSLFEKEAEKAGVKDVTVVNHWAYADSEAGIKVTREHLTETSLRAMVKPMNGYYHWNLVRQSGENSRIMAELAHECGVEGYSSYTEWEKSFDRTDSLQASFAWNMAAAPTVPEATRLYAERLFPGRVSDACRGFGLLDFLSAPAKDPTALSTRTLTENWLAYYFYSYVRKGKEYPQNYPGRAITSILERRDEAEDLIVKVSRAAEKAMTIFSDISDDPACDMDMARRYAVEAERYLCLADDFLALLDMYELNKKPTAKNLALIKQTARDRADANRLLNFDLETVKDRYVLPSQLRNVSIYMQTFEDIADYLERTKPEDVKLDFENLMPILSARSLSIR